MHGFYAGLRVGGLIFDCFVIYWAKNLFLMKEETEQNTNDPTAPQHSSTAENGQPPQEKEKFVDQFEDDVKAMQALPPEISSQTSL